jgi:hypothetical protein
MQGSGRGQFRLRIGPATRIDGTTMFLVATIDEAATTPSMWGTVGALEGTRNLAGGLATSGTITSWLADLTGTTYPDLLAEAPACGSDHASGGQEWLGGILEPRDRRGFGGNPSNLDWPSCSSY